MPLSFRRTRGRWGQWMALWLLAVICAGCGKSDEAAIESNANGYICSACSTKFYTSRDVFAEQCPQCKSADLKAVVAFVCPKGHSTLIARGPQSAACGQCGEKAVAQKVPHAAELQAWGATQKNKADVLPGR